MRITADGIREQLGLADNPASWEDAKVFDRLRYIRIVKGGVLFPRLDVEKELKELETLEGADV